MGFGAIVLIGAEPEGFCSTVRQSPGESLLAEPMECVEILGRTMAERCVELLARIKPEAITVLAPEGYEIPAFLGAAGNVKVQRVADLASATANQLRSYSERGIEHSFVMFGSVYAEADFLDLFYFHREARQAVTRAVDRDGELNLWVVDCWQAQSADLETLLTRSQETGSTYFVRDYVKRLTHPRELRSLVSDALCGRCAMRPTGREIKPGIWVEEGADIHKRARIVAPAFIGRGAQLQEDTLITRCSSIEKDCCVDCGSVIEDSSLLAYTQVGIWLDVCHAIANGNRLLSLGHEVVLEISDPGVLRSSAPAGANAPRVEWRAQEHYVQQQAAAERKREQAQAAEAWQLGTNPIGGD